MRRAGHDANNVHFAAKQCGELITAICCCHNRPSVNLYLLLSTYSYQEIPNSRAYFSVAVIPNNCDRVTFWKL